MWKWKKNIFAINPQTQIQNTYISQNLGQFDPKDWLNPD